MDETRSPVSIGDTMKLVAEAIGTPPDDVKGFVVIAIHDDDNVTVSHNAKTYHQLIATLMKTATHTLEEMDVDQLIEFRET